MANVVALHDLSITTGEEGPVRDPVAVLLDVERLRPGIQLRAGKLNREHLDSIALSEENWPPIIIRRDDNTIVDGHYRYLAARQLGRSHVRCVYFDGEVESAFMEALRQNRDHGLPLSFKDREAAARQVLRFHPDWSDRRVGATCGLAPGTVGRLRGTIATVTDQGGQLNARVGRDGRRRPVDAKASRIRIARVLRDQPNSSLRNIARITGTSPATVRAVKAEQSHLAVEDRPQVVPVIRPVRSWVADAALLSAEEGETFVGWFERTTIKEEWRSFLAGIPLSRVYEVADEARRRAAAWTEFASRIEERVRPARR